MILKPDEIKDDEYGGAFLHFKTMPPFGFLKDWIVDKNMSSFFIRDRVVSSDGSGWLHVIPFDTGQENYINGDSFLVVKTNYPEGYKYDKH